MRYPNLLDPGGRTLGEEEVEAAARVIRSGVLNAVWGSEVRALELQMAQLHGVAYAVAASSGTAALHLAVAAVAADPGDEIITSPISDFGTVAPILAQNLVPVFADVDPLTGNLDPDRVAELVGPRTRAILAVHLFGAAAPVDRLRAIADRHGIPLIEDCAQAWLTRLPSPAPQSLNPAPLPDVRLAGTGGAVGCFSLQQWKHITCGDGGLAITDSAGLARRMRLFADKGWPRDTGRHHASFGLNYRMTELCGAVARAQLAKLPGVLAARRAAAGRLVAAVGDLPGIQLPRDVESHAFWLMPVVVEPPRSAAGFAEVLAAAGVPARAGYLDEPLHCAPALTGAPVYGSSRYPLTSTYGPGLCPVAERMVAHRLVVIDWNERYTESHVDAIAGAIRDAHGKTA